jgi:hypothetical protein
MTTSTEGKLKLGLVKITRVHWPRFLKSEIYLLGGKCLNIEIFQDEVLLTLPIANTSPLQKLK